MGNVDFPVRMPSIVSRLHPQPRFGATAEQRRNLDSNRSRKRLVANQACPRSDRQPVAPLGMPESESMTT